LPSVDGGLYAFFKANAFAKTYTFRLGEEVMCSNKITPLDLADKVKIGKYIFMG